MKAKLGWLALWVALVAGLGLRLAVVLDDGPAPRHDLFPGMDEVNYHELAENLRTSGAFAAWTGGFLTRSTRAPGYPAVLAAATLLTRNSPWTAPLLNLAFDCVNLWLIFLIAKALYGKMAGRLAVGLYALFGPVFLYLPLATPEMMAVTLILLVGLCLIQLREHYWRTVPALGILYALLIHTRPVFLLLIPVVGLCAWLELAGGAWRVRLARAVLPAVLVLALCLPWGIRNWRLHQAVVPVCVTAGWHLVNRAQTTADLSVKFLTDYIYAPAHAKFAEGDYYREGMKLSGELFRREPFRVLGNGALRVIHGWILPQSPFRFFLPRAYVRPVFLGERWFIPVPDAEGLLYLAVGLTVLGAVWWRRRWRQCVGTWFRQSRSLLLLLFAYAIVHILGFPLIQYRFIIEPVMLILGVGLVVGYLAVWRVGRASAAEICNLKSEIAPFLSAICSLPSPFAKATADRSVIRSPSCEFRGAENLPLGFSALFLVAILTAWGVRSDRPWLCYPDLAVSPGQLNYRLARQGQWRNAGDLPPASRAAFAGVVRYSRPGLVFPADWAVAVPAAQGTVAMLYVNCRDERFAGTLGELGLGDCKLNFAGPTVPHDGDTIQVQGILKTGAYKDLILDVESWQKF